MGCKARCVFCDQRVFSRPAMPEDIPALVENFLARCSSPSSRRRVLAFYGGTFTGIEADLLRRYLDVTRDLVEKGVVHAAKASTRPDMVDEEKLGLLVDSGFEELEIGCQSLDDPVLEASGRGHTVKDVVEACRLVRGFGLRLGIQLMPGLPSEDLASFVTTVKRSAALKPHAARIYPTVVMAGTRLEGLYRTGAYTPLTLGQAVRMTLYAVAVLERQGCTILRMGLPDPGAQNVVAGPYHPSLGFLVRSEAYRLMAGLALSRHGGGARLVVNPRSLCELLGPGRANARELTFAYGCDDTLPVGTLRVEAGTDRACIQLQDILEYIL